MPFDIPKHNCRNCGSCCGPVPITKTEKQTIQTYVDLNKPKIATVRGLFDCKFRVDNGCSIYLVRPILCRLCGVVEGMVCKYGNSHNIDGQKFIDTKNVAGFVNTINTKY